MELEANPGRLGLGEALTGSALGGLEPGQLDDAGGPAKDELDGHVDLGQGDRERIRIAEGRDPIADVMHIPNVGRGTKREWPPRPRSPLNMCSTGSAWKSAVQTASANGSTNWLL